MNEVKLGGVDSSIKGGSTAAKPHPESQQTDSASSLEGSSQHLKKAEEAIQNSVEKVEQNQQAQEQQLEVAVTQLNDYIQNVQRDLHFKTDDASGKTVVTVVDRQTSEVVRQIPDDVALSLAQNLQQDEPLSLFNIKA